jgi:hypothetical protein
MIPESSPTRWATSEGVFLFQVPEEGSILSTEVIILLSSSLYAISIFFDQGEIKFSEEMLSIISLNFHPPHSMDEPENDKEQGFVVHSSFDRGICFQSIFHAASISNELSEFENAFLESVVNNLHNTLEREGRSVSDIPFLKDRKIINEIEEMLKDIDTKYKSLVASWSLAQGSESQTSRYDFTNVVYNGKIRMEELLYDLGERAIEAFNELLMSKHEKTILYRIAKSLVSLSNLLYEKELTETTDLLKFSHSEIILEANQSKKLFRLDVRSYEIDGEEYCDITIMSN